MRITAIKAENIPPIAKFEITGLGAVVIVAGANGSGKTRLKEAIKATFAQPNRPAISLTIESTRPDEEAGSWNCNQLIVRAGAANELFTRYLSSKRLGGTYTGSLIQIDSNRNVEPVKFDTISLATPDPDDEEIPPSYFLSSFTSRWQRIVNSVFKKVANRDHKIAQYVKQNPDRLSSEAIQRFPDPFVPYQEVFAQLLPGKSLLPIDPKKQGEFHYRVGAGDPLVFATLSSGEQEVVKIVFDLISKQIRHCVVLVDEPELHLHPTLAFRLVEAMKNVGDNTNQFIFFTHSADLISTYYSSGNVYFVDLVDPEHNQARQLTALDKNHVQTARAIGANLGLFAVGKKLVFVEGTEASVDRLTYYRIAQRVFPEAYILPAGAVGNIMSLGRLSAELQRSVFGIDFFMIRDRDGLTDGQIRDLEKNPRFRCLRRRHIENYFLDAEVLALVGEQFYLDPKWRSAHQVDESLRDIATKVIGQATVFAVKHFVTLNGAVDAPSVSGADEMSVADIESELARAVRQSLTSVSEACSENALLEKFRQHRSMLEESLRGSTWKEIFPGKLVFARYCGTIRQQVSRVREAYVDIALKKKPSVFEPVETIFRSFADVV